MSHVIVEHGTKDVNSTWMAKSGSPTDLPVRPVATFASTSVST